MVEEFLQNLFLLEFECQQIAVHRVDERDRNTGVRDRLLDRVEILAELQILPLMLFLAL